MEATTKKAQQLLLYSNPEVVLKKAKEYGYDPDKIYLSNSKRHKYTYITPEGKKVHFGYWGMLDYTRHKDPKRLEQFRSRNKKWATAPWGSPAHLAYFLLW